MKAFIQMIFRQMFTIQNDDDDDTTVNFITHNRNIGEIFGKIVASYVTK